MLAECFVGVDDCYAGGTPAQFAGFGLLVPERFGEQEVVVLQFSLEIAGRDVEVGRPSAEIVVHSVSLSRRRFPTRMVAISVEGMVGISPGIVESLDGVVVFLLAHGHNQILILDGPAISEGDLVALGADLVNAHVVGLTNIFADELAGGSPVIEFGDAG